MWSNFSASVSGTWIRKPVSQIACASRNACNSLRGNVMATSVTDTLRLPG